MSVLSICSAFLAPMTLLLVSPCPNFDTWRQTQGTMCMICLIGTRVLLNYHPRKCQIFLWHAWKKHHFEVFVKGKWTFWLNQVFPPILIVHLYLSSDQLGKSRILNLIFLRFSSWENVPICFIPFFFIEKVGFLFCFVLKREFSFGLRIFGENCCPSYEYFSLC